MSGLHLFDSNSVSFETRPSGRVPEQPEAVSNVVASAKTSGIGPESPIPEPVTDSNLAT